ncbi:hypothetical protein B9T31_16935 [Acinetobacter sp. ANC 4558]|uniref:ATP-grasp fold amidoligase family protein n=1 Tax=Acinetobacter sp. ANC 4558 TaxID=1977876 RepID=UPI000A32E754|nr:ATP-grasp fold amidoligase family protein [Acinetobacter sp. ANC 4558]OTG79574.1 hypothetical protein B9T31_16935 [Acinetobacter sp. ANC 4558]
MFCYNILITGNININIRNDIKNSLKEAKEINGWGRFSNTNIMLCIEGVNVNYFLLTLQQKILEIAQASISITSVAIQGYQGLYFIDGSILNAINEKNYINYFSQLINTSDRNLKLVTNEIGRNASSNPDLYKDKKLHKLFQVVPSKYIPESLLIKKAFNSSYLPYLPSFSAQLTEYTIFRKVVNSKKGFTVEGIINNKVKAINFAKALKVPVPEIYQKSIGKEEINYDLKNVVLKPMDGDSSKDVFIISNDFIQSVEKREKIDLSTMKSQVEKSPYKIWMVEQYIPGFGGEIIPYDIKLFCFYGAIKLILVIDRNSSKLRHEWLDENFKRVNTGRFNDSLFVSNFNNPAIMNIGKSLSLNVPTPFLRIDFLASENEIYFGEITPRPGHFDEFNRDVDTQLGYSFIAARARLMTDLLGGKKFEEFNKLLPVKRTPAKSKAIAKTK